MDTMHQFKKSVDSLKDINLSTAAKIENYSNLRNSFLPKLTQEEAMKNEGMLRCLFNCMKLDVDSESVDLRQSVLTILDLMCKSPWTNFIAQDLIDICVHLTFDDVTKGTDDFQAVTLKCLECVLRQLILQNDCDPETILLKASKGVARKKIVELFEKVCEDLPKQLSSLFFYEKIVSAMFNTSSIDIRAFLVEFVIASLPKYEIGLLSLDKQEKFKLNTKKIYVERTVQLLEAEDPSWTNVWIFLVRCHGKKLHMHSDIMNALLKVVEVAFRSKVLTNNSAAYDCWKELINVYSLDLEQMCTPKYMKLFLLPLKNNSLKNGNLTKKRFEVWAHLIGILQEKSFELCLRQFLEFCFGPLGENPLITRGNPNIGSPARNDPDLWQSSARALLELIDDDSLGRTNHSVLKLEAPLITTDNYMAMDYIIINSVGECCSLILNRMNKESTKKLGIKTITSLWKSLFHIINRLDKTDQDNTIRRVTALLAVFIELSNETPAYFDYILKPIFELFSTEKFFHIDIQRINTQLLFPLLKKFFKHNDAVFLGGKDTILKLLQCSKNTHNKNSWLEETFEVFLKSEPRQGNVKGLLLLWVDCADVINNLCDFPTGQTEKVVQSVGIGFMLWPVLNMFRLSPETPIVTIVAQTWGNTFANMLKTYTKESLAVLTDIRKGIDSSPAIACHVAKLFPAFCPLLDTKPNHKFVMTLLNLTSTLLGAPTVTKEIKGLILPALLLIMQYFNEETEKKLKYSDFQHLCQCFEYLLRIHKEYSILDSLESFLDNIPRTFQENVPQSLRAVFDALKAHSDDNISQKAKHLSSKFINCLAESSSKTEQTFLQTKFVHLSRAAKITNMAVAVPKSPKLGNSEGTNVFRLLGHKVETSSPVRVRGSQLGNTKESQKRKAANVFPEVKRSKVRVDDEEASFVLIDDPYQFDPAKLSEHQMEVMKHRRSDIPALYQDLTQSQSNSESFVNKYTDILNKVEEKSELGASNKRNGSSNQTEIAITSEVLFDTEDLVSVEPLMISNSNENNKHTKDVEDKSVLVNSETNFQNYPECKAFESEAKKKLLVIPKCEESVGNGTEKTEVSSLNQSKRGRPRILKPKQLNKATKAKKIEYKTTTTALPTSESHLEEKGTNTSAIKNSDEPVDVNSEDSCSARIDLKIQNPSMKKIEAMIAEDCPANYNQGFASPVLKQNTTSNEACQQENILNENKPSNVNEDHKNISDEDKRKQKIVVELNKLKMDIVGGDAFVRNLNLTERVRTRRSADATTLALRSGTKINYDSDDSKSSSSSDSSRKSKLRATVKLIEKTAKDKLTLSPKNSNKLQVAPSSHSKSNLKLSQVQSKNINLEVEKNELSSNKQIKKRRRSVSGLEEPAQSGEENRNPRTRSKSVTPEKLSPITENLRRSPRSDKNWIAQVNKSLVECAKNSKARARKSLASALESASKADIGNNQSKVATKAKQNKPNLFEVENKIEENLEFTVTLVNDAESPSSEDVIESSQESAVDTKLCPNVDSPLKNINKSIDLEIEEVLAHLKKRKVQNADTVGVVIANRADNAQVVASSLSSCPDSVNSIELDKLSPFSPDELMRMDLASLTKPTDSDTCEMDTETLELLSETPTKKSLSIPTSPIGSDTPNRTSELISNTLDISPIKLVPKTTNIENTNERTTPDLFDSEPSTSNKNSIPIVESQVKQRSDTKSPSPSEINITSVQDTPHQQPSCSTISEITNQRSLKLLRMLPHTPLPENYKIPKLKQTSKPFSASPKTHRIKIMMQPFEKKSESIDVEEIVDLDDLDEEPMNVIQERDILKFVKELPSPMASPKCSILKRKAPEVRDEGLSPPRKKRVNFSDPPTTCEKVFFKDKNEHFHSKKDEYSGDTSYSNGTNVLQTEVISTSSSNTDPPILEPMEYIEPPVLEAMKNMPTPSINNFTNAEPPLLEEAPSEKETESLVMETQGSIDVIIPHLLEYNQPILPEFLDCKESIDCVVGKLASPLFVQVLANDLLEKNIRTVGDLAKLSEIEVTRLPFRTPKVLVVRTTLRKFMSQKSGDDVNIESGPNKCTEDEFVIGDDKLGLHVEEKSIGTNSDQEHKRNSVLVTDRPKLVAGDSLPSALLSPTSSSSKVTLVSSIVIKPAHTVAQNSTRVDRSPRRVPLIKVTTSNTPTCSTFVQLEPIVTATVKPSGSKESDCSKPVIFGNAEEREKLRIRIPELIADFQEMREKVKRQGLSTTSLYELIIEIVGMEEFVAILQGNKALSINHFVKNDDWCTLLKEILHNIGLDKTVSCLCNAWKVTPAKVVNCVIDHITTEKKGKFRSASLETIVYRLLKTVPLQNILQKFGMRHVVDALCEMNNSLQFTVEDFFQHATFRFSPSLDQMVPSFANINIVQLSDDTPLSNNNKKDLEVFLNRVGTLINPKFSENCNNHEVFLNRVGILMNPKFSENCNNQISESVDIVICVPEEKKEEVTCKMLNELPLPNKKEAVASMVDKMSVGDRRELIFSMFDKMSDIDIFDCCTDYFRQRLQKT